ncbi:hypothetical protein AB6A40_006842 [Gnathostoma spinigerum]|uniref:Uncharacterized protein n=1 Tax=Gnathostoma spinigerum TaxID=75299 RepID=A0ABD6EJR3_9BILA
MNRSEIRHNSASVKLDRGIPRMYTSTASSSIGFDPNIPQSFHGRNQSSFVRSQSEHYLHEKYDSSNPMVRHRSFSTLPEKQLGKNEESFCANLPLTNNMIYSTAMIRKMSRSNRWSLIDLPDENEGEIDRSSDRSLPANLRTNESKTGFRPCRDFELVTCGVKHTGSVYHSPRTNEQPKRNDDEKPFLGAPPLERSEASITLTVSLAPVKAQSSSHWKTPKIRETNSALSSQHRLLPSTLPPYRSFTAYFDSKVVPRPSESTMPTTTQQTSRIETPPKPRPRSYFHDYER